MSSEVLQQHHLTAGVCELELQLPMPDWLNERDPAVSSRETIDRSRGARRSVMLASSKARSALRGDMSDLPYRRVSSTSANDSVILTSFEI